MGVSSREYDIQTLHPGWAEQDPLTWYQAVIQAVQEALFKANLTPKEIAAIGFSGQMHGMVCLDLAGKALRPAIIWADQRSQAQVAFVDQSIGKEQLGKWTGNPLATGFMLASWLWLRQNRPEEAKSTTYLLLPKDYLRYKFTGEIGSEPSDASSTLLFDTANRQWCLPLLERLDISTDILPPIHESAQVAGGLARKVANATSLLPGTPVVFGGSDQACQAIGHAVIDSGTISSTIGTGGQLFAPFDLPRYDPELRLHLFCHALPQVWHLESAILSAGLSLKWLRDHLKLAGSYQELADLAAQSPPGSDGLIFTPYLLGERTPHMDTMARATFTGLSLNHTRAHIIRSVMEGVVFALRQGLEIMHSLGVDPDKIIASGGASANPLWLQLQADIFNRPIYRSTTVEAAAFGAALLAGVGVGIFPHIRAACQQAITLRDDAVQPDLQTVNLYTEQYSTFCQIYPALQKTFP
jgi:xylulokinase